MTNNLVVHFMFMDCIYFFNKTFQFKNAKDSIIS